jgi:ceroid-lipofuscinosis MFS transporter 7
MHPPIHYGTSQSPTTEEASFSSSESKISLAVIMLVVLVGDMARGILFPTLWPYVSMLGGSKAVLGFLVASFSFGRVISSPALGRWSGSVGYRKTLVGAQLTIALGTAMYASSTSLWMLALAQVIMGLGSGTLGVTRAYVAEKSSHEQKTYMLAYLTYVLLIPPVV